MRAIAFTAPAPFVDQREGSPVASVAVFFFASWAKCEETWECDKFPRARTSFERALYVQTTPFASVGDILKAVGEEDRHDFRYCHLAFAIWTDFHGRHYGTCQLDAHHVSFRPTKCRGERKGSPWSGCLSV
jgi:hypothetical protein